VEAKRLILIPHSEHVHCRPECPKADDCHEPESMTTKFLAVAIVFGGVYAHLLNQVSEQAAGVIGNTQRLQLGPCAFSKFLLALRNDPIGSNHTPSFIELRSDTQPDPSLS
jgi:hypothetical protein